MRIVLVIYSLTFHSIILKLVGGLHIKPQFYPSPEFG